MQKISDKLNHDDNFEFICDSDDSMPSTERELADNAQWKIIQKNTFTRWVNVHLKTANKSIVDLQTDFSDGLKLIALIEVLSGHKFGRYNKRTTFVTQKLENVTMVLKFLEEKEGLKLVNIDSSDIVDCRLKLILGLVWMLILHYSISMPVWEGEESTKEEEDTKQTPKQRMMTWIHSKLPDLPVRNLTTDWNDGKAIGALVDSCAPGLCPDWCQWNKVDALQNTKEAMDTAEKWLEIPQLIKPEEMTDPNVDEKAMMTYLSQFPNAKVKEDAPLRPKLNPNKVRVYGPGIESKNLVVNNQTEFTIDAFSAGKGNLIIEITKESNGEKLKVDIEQQASKSNTYKCYYTPTSPDKYLVSVKYAEQEIPKSPIVVQIDKMPMNINKVDVYGPGVDQNGVLMNTPTEFTIDTRDAGNADVDCVILDNNRQKDSVIPEIIEQSPGIYKVQYTPNGTGVYSVNVYFDGQQVPKSPFAVRVSPRSNVRMIHVTGRGVQGSGIRVGDNVEFCVDASNAGEGNLEMKLLDPTRKEISIKSTEVNPSFFKCLYVPARQGQYQLSIDYDGVSVGKSPYKINVLPAKESSIVAYGAGLERSVVDKPAIFVVDTNEESGTLGFSIEGPSQAKIECCDNQDGSVTVCYFPTVVGEYAVHILVDNEDIPNSPYMAQVVPKDDKSNVSKIKVSGPGLIHDKVYMNKMNEFTIDCSDYDDFYRHKPVVTCYQGDGSKTVPVTMNTSGRKYHCKYQPTTEGNHKVFIVCDDQPVDKSPFKINVPKLADPSKVRLIGDGFEKAVRFQPTKFSIDTTQAGDAQVTVDVTDELGNSLPITINNKTDADIFDVEYKPTSAGPFYDCRILFNGQSIPGSPFNIEILPEIDVSGVFVESLAKKIFQESFVRFTVNATAIDKVGKGTVKAIFTDPNGLKSACMVKNMENGIYKCNYSPYNAGTYQLQVTYNDLPIKTTPLKVEVVPGCDPSRISVYGDGLKGGLTNQRAQFTIDLDGAGQGNLALAIEGPADAQIKCTDNLDGTCTVEYCSILPGLYDIYIKFNDEDIKDSPYKVQINDPINPEKVKLYGAELNPNTDHRIGQPIRLVVDSSRAGDAPLLVDFTNNQGKKLPVTVEQRENAMPGIYDITITPEKVGKHDLDIKFAGKSILDKSPCHLQILPETEPEKIKFSGEGIYPQKNYLVPGEPVQFRVDTSKAGEGDLTIGLENPDGQMLPTVVTDEGNGVYLCEYTPIDAGNHVLSVGFNGQDIPKTPVNIKVTPVGQAKKCFIEEGASEFIPVNTESIITVNTSQAGQDGKLSCRILPSNDKFPTASLIPCEIEDNNNGTQSIYYTPTEIGSYNFEIKYGGVIIPGGRFNQNAVDQENMPEETIEMEKTQGQNTGLPQNGFSSFDSQYGLYPVTFKFPYKGNNVEAVVITPSSIRELIQVDTTSHKGYLIVHYEPKMRGMHELIISVDEKPIRGSPFRFFAENIGAGKVAAYGPGLSHGQTGLPAEFTIVTKSAGEGGLSLAIEGPSKAEIHCHDNENGTCDVEYYPMTPGEYSIVIKFADKNIAGSPFLANIIGDTQRKSQICIGSTSDVPLQIENLDISTLTASVTSPSGKAEPCILKRIPNDNLGISFTPKETGDHFINVYQSGSHIVGSPFKIVVGQAEIGDASKVRVYGDGLKNGRSNESNSFTVDTKEAGYGGLSLSIEGPSKAEIECRDNHDGTCQVSYIPSEPGTYMINIKYAGDHVLGSPFAVKIDGEASAKLMEKIIRRQEVADITQVGSQCELTLKIPGTNPSDMRATVTNESGSTEKCEIVDLDQGQYSIKFVPHEMGVHTVSVQHKSVHIPGSPFQFTVGPIIDGGAHKVVASGPGLRSGRVNQINEFGIYTREAGAGGLSIAIEGPSKAEIDFEDRKDGSCNVKYHVTQPGEYQCSVKFNDDHIRNSPFRIIVTESPTDFISMATVGTGNLHSAPQFQQHQLSKEWTIGKPAALTINYVNQYHHSSSSSSNVTSKLRAIVTCPSGKEETAIVQNIEKNQYAIRFMPKESGEHLINVTEEGSNQHITGSPFRIVIGHHHADPSMVRAYGEGLVEGFVESKNKFIVNTTDAGTGELNVTIDGPSKVQLYSQEHEEGYEFIYTPHAQGDYYVTVKYGGNYNIAGSPFKVSVSGSGNDSIVPSQAKQQQAHLQLNTSGRTPASPVVVPQNNSLKKSQKVHCSGIGMKKAYLGKVNAFTVDASQAGNDILFVGIAGPHSQCEEVSVKHVGQNQFSINYRVQEKGRHFLIVKWGDHNIPGSPFVVDV